MLPILSISSHVKSIPYQRYQWMFFFNLLIAKNEETHNFKIKHLEMNNNGLIKSSVLIINVTMT